MSFLWQSLSSSRMLLLTGAAARCCPTTTSTSAITFAASRRTRQLLLHPPSSSSSSSRSWLSTTTTTTTTDSNIKDNVNNNNKEENEQENNNNNEEFVFSMDDQLLLLHHGRRPRMRHRPKFKSPRKRASKLLDELHREVVQQNQQSRPAVFDTAFRVGDAVELQVISEGGIHTTDHKRMDKIRGVVLAKRNRGLGTAISIRDVVFGEPVERKIPLHSPLVKSLKVLEKNFVFKGKRKVKRAKLYYLRNRLPIETRVTKW